MKKKLKILFIILLLMSFIGEFFTLDYRNNFSPQPRTFNETLKSIDSAFTVHGENEKFLDLAGKFYSRGINYSWTGNNTEIPIWKNYIFYSLSKIEKFLTNLKFIDSNNSRFSKFESNNYEISLGRGFGICSQNSLGLSDLLNDRYNIKTKIVGLEGHVVVYYKTKSLEMFIDPSLGISFETNHNIIDNQLEEIQILYNKTDHPYLGKTFNKKGNVIPKTHGGKGYKYYFFIFEDFASVFKYLFPIIGLFILNFRKTNNLTK